MIEIPLTTAPSQTFAVTLEKRKYSFDIKINSRSNLWSLNITNDQGETIAGIKMVAGVNLLAPFNIGINNLFVIDLENTKQDPVYKDFGIVSKLYFLEIGDDGYPV